MRTVQPRGEKGSLRWMQQVIGLKPDLLRPEGLGPIEWLSPLETDDFAEYRDAAFLDRLGLDHLTGDLRAFWPARGPQWDALGRTEKGPVLVEAKAHVAEFFSPPSAATPSSLEKIEAAFRSVQQDLGIKSAAPWTRHFYQYANRIAHLWWLRQNGIDAKLLFVSFLDDDEMGGPSRAETWHAAYAAADYVLGLRTQHKLKRHILHVSPSVSLLRG